MSVVLDAKRETRNERALQKLDRDYECCHSFVRFFFSRFFGAAASRRPLSPPKDRLAPHLLSSSRYAPRSATPLLSLPDFVPRGSPFVLNTFSQRTAPTRESRTRGGDDDGEEINADGDDRRRCFFFYFFFFFFSLPPSFISPSSPRLHPPPPPKPPRLLSSLAPSGDLLRPGRARVLPRGRVRPRGRRDDEGRGAANSERG